MAHSQPNYPLTQPTAYDVEAEAAKVQRGEIPRPTFFGDHQYSKAFSIFNIGVRTALSYSGQSARKNDDPETTLLTNDEWELLRKRARSISNYSKVPYDTCEDFLIILCYINNIKDMIKIADAVQIPELADEKILQKPSIILNLRGLENISFAAQALDGLVNLFRKYIGTAQNVANKSSAGNDLGSILNTISSLAGGIGGASAGPRLETAELGNFLSELITGNRIPNNVIAKNPMLQQPSYVGKAFFGEFPNPLANIDINQLFNKPIAVFPQPSSGTGTTSFSMQNFSSFSGSMNIQSFAAKVLTGSTDISSQRKLNQITDVVNKITNLTGAKPNDIIEIQRADNAMPMMMALSTIFSGFDKSVYPSSTFQDGWVAAQAAASQMASVNPSFIEAARRFL